MYSPRIASLWTIMVLLIVRVIDGQDGLMPTTEQPTDAPPIVESPNQQPLDKAMLPVYTMTNYFLEVVLRPPSVVELNKSVDLTDPNEIQESMKSNWQLWLRHYNSYLICLVLAAAYILVVPITGCTLCACRARGRCGKKQTTMDGKNTKHKRRCCASLLVFIVIALLLGIVVFFLANSVIFKQTELDGVPGTLAGSLNRIDEYKNVAKESYNMEVGGEFMSQVSSVTYDIKNIPELCQQEVGKQTKCGDLLSVIESYVDKLDAVRKSFSLIDELVDSINDGLTELDAEIADLNINISRDFTPCVLEDCKKVLNITSSLQTVADFAMLDDMVDFDADFFAEMNDTGNVYEGLVLAQDEFDQVGLTIRNTSNETLHSLSDEADKATQEIHNFLNSSRGAFDALSFSGIRAFVNQTLNPQMQKYGRYRYYGGLTVGSIVLLITTLSCVGLLFGACGSRKGKAAQGCNKGASVKVLWFTLCLICIFAWILMAITAVLLPLGAIPHNDICHHLSDLSDGAAVQVIDDIISINLNISFSFYDMYKSCSDDKALYTALNLENRGAEYNITNVLDIDKYDFKRNFEVLQSTAYDPGSLFILNNILENTLANLVSVTETIDVTAHKAELSKDILSHDLVEFAQMLDAAATSNPSKMELFQRYSQVVTEIHTSTYRTIHQNVTLLREKINTLSSFLNDYNMTVTMTELRSAQTRIVPEVLSNATKSVTDTIYTTAEGIFADAQVSIRDHLARCGVVASAVSDSMDGVCIKLLYPFNAFWFSLGWCLFFFLFIIPIVKILGDYYRKTEEYTSDSTSFDQPFSNDLSREIPRPHIISGSVANSPLPELPGESRVPYQPIQEPRSRQKDVEPSSSRNGGLEPGQHSQWTNLAYNNDYNEPKPDYYYSGRDDDETILYRPRDQDRNRHPFSNIQKNRETLYPEDGQGDFKW